MNFIQQQIKKKKIFGEILGPYYGPNLIIGWQFTSWQSDNPNFWLVTGESGSDPMVTEGFDNKSCRIYTSGSNVAIWKDNLLTVGKKYRVILEIKDVTSGELKLYNSGDLISWDLTGSKSYTFTAVHSDLYIRCAGSLSDVTFTNVVVQEEINRPVFNLNSGFGDGTYLNEWAESLNNGIDAVFSIVTNPVYGGTYALKGTHSTKDVFNRCEMVPKFMGESQGFLHDVEYWMGWRVYLENWNTNPAGWNILAQLHAVPQHADWATNSGKGPWTLSTAIANWDAGSVDYDAMYFNSQVFADPYAGDPNDPIANAWVIPVPPHNTWLKFVVNFKISTTSAGFIKFWYNDLLVVDQAGPNIHALDTDGDLREKYTILQMGSYKELNSTNVRTFYLDRIKIAGEQATYSDVA